MPDNIVEDIMSDAQSFDRIGNNENSQIIYTIADLLAAFEKIKQHFEKGVVLRSDISDKTKGKIELLNQLISSLK